MKSELRRGAEARRLQFNAKLIPFLAVNWCCCRVPHGVNCLALLLTVPPPVPVRPRSPPCAAGVRLSPFAACRAPSLSLPPPRRLVGLLRVCRRWAGVLLHVSRLRLCTPRRLTSARHGCAVPRPFPPASRSAFCFPASARRPPSCVLFAVARFGRPATPAARRLDPAPPAHRVHLCSGLSELLFFSGRTACFQSSSALSRFHRYPLSSPPLAPRLLLPYLAALLPTPAPLSPVFRSRSSITPPKLHLHRPPP